MIIKGNSGALASVVSGNSGGASAPVAVAVVGGGGGDISGVTFTHPDAADPVEFTFEDGAWWGANPKQLAEGADISVTIANGVIAIVAY